ncbi:MAG: hypothetical protein K2X93_14615 [Candidatus Obscuribacterales bacterium]|nr:hypothetical protein [Candidatus Obscuribacterales bacterium]
MRSLTGLTTPVVTLVIAMLMMLIPAQVSAAPTAWQPAFNNSTPVYIDPAIAGHPNFPVSMPGLSQKLDELGAKNNVKFFVIALEQSTETGSGNLAAPRLDEILLRWQGGGNFPSDNYLLVLWMRSASNPSVGWVAVNAGSGLKTYGLTKQQLDSADGPVLPSLKRFMPQDPKGCFQSIATSVNKVIDDYNLEQERQKENAKFYSRLPIYGLIVIAVGGAVGVYFWLARAKAGLKVAAETVIGDWTAKMDSANSLYMRLRKGYLGFVQDQVDWKGKFTGTTKSQYEGALTNFADFAARLAKANELLTSAKRTFEKGDYKGCMATLQEEKVTVDGLSIAIEDATLFGGLVKKTDYKPSDLLESMAALFEQTNQALAGIMTALREALEAGNQLDAAQAEIARARTSMGEAKFAPYISTFDEIDREEEAVRTTFKSDPVAAKGAMLELVKRAKALQSKANS